MNRIRKHRIKEEKATTSSSNVRSKEEHDLAYFIHDRVELMHQVFSVLKSKELKSLAPECVRRLSIDDLQELCLEELLGISSKRLCAILDGADPPSDTESSSQSEQLETISLDSISSDDEILSQGSGKKKKHKHRHSKKKRRKKSKGSDAEQGETRASRAGLTVLELLELQARARAIRAQLHQEPTRAAEPAAGPPSDNDEVLIKEEPAEVVEISSDEEKPDVGRLAQQIGTSQGNKTETNKKDDSQAVTNRINDLIITVPQSKPTRRIKLKRQKPTETVTKAATTTATTDKDVEKQVVIVSNTASKTDTANSKNSEAETKKVSNVEVKNKSKKNKKKKKKVQEKEGSDEDEITIQLSDTEKMDLLEDLEAKNFDTVSSSDSDSSDGDENQNDTKVVDEKDKVDTQNNDKTSEIVYNTQNKNESSEKTDIAVNPEEKKVNKDEIKGYVSNDNKGTVEINDLPVVTDDINSNDDKSSSQVDDKLNDQSNNSQVNDKLNEAKSDVETVKSSREVNTDDAKEKSDDKPENSDLVTKSDGEISDRESSEVEASDVQREVVCISDDDGKKKKKKKKEKKSKKEKKKSDFREGRDENFYKEQVQTNMNIIESIDDEDDVYEYLEISDDSSCYEVEGVSVLSKEPTAEEIEAFSARMDEIDLEREETIPSEDIRTDKPDLDADIENVSWKDRYLGSRKVKRVLTTSNILNAIRKKNRELKKKLEEAKKAEQVEKEEEKVEDSPTIEDGSIEQYETLQGSTKYVDPVKDATDVEERNEKREISKELIEKDADNSKEQNEKDSEISKEQNEKDSEMSKEQNEKDAVVSKEQNEKHAENSKEQNEKHAENSKEQNENVTKEMKKDAKMLLKMYKRLLKYNDVNKQKDPSKKKKKKQKKNKDRDKVKA